MKCPIEGCAQKADTMVFSSKKYMVVEACYKHAKEIVDEEFPEYIETCPHCGCLIPVN